MPKKTADVSVTTEQITEGIYVRALDHGQLSILCNYCSEEFFKGSENDAPDTRWLAEIITHITSVHPERLTT